ncbi:hypothetical protein ACSBR1_027466 [Camellia fascicularis]
MHKTDHYILEMATWLHHLISVSFASSISNPQRIESAASDNVATPIPDRFSKGQQCPIVTRR